MTELLIYLAVSAAGLIAFIVKDALNAFDRNPTTPTLSSKIEAWRRRHPRTRGLLILGSIAQAILVLVWLAIHLTTEVF